jgi:hypothetical protein
MLVYCMAVAVVALYCLLYSTEAQAQQATPPTLCPTPPSGLEL